MTSFAKCLSSAPVAPPVWWCCSHHTEPECDRAWISTWEQLNTNTQRCWEPKTHFSWMIFSTWSLETGNWVEVQPLFAWVSEKCLLSVRDRSICQSHKEWLHFILVKRQNLSEQGLGVQSKVKPIPASPLQLAERREVNTGWSIGVVNPAAFPGVFSSSFIWFCELERS